ncbi:MAG: mobilization protein [Prevotella sp.]|jgi:cell division protein FtsB|nr:mobilization protein [Prevotella sp.]
MAQQTSDHIKPCNIGQSEEHNKRTPEYLAHINKEKIYLRLDLMADNESWTAPQMEGMDLKAYYDSIAAMVKEKTGRALQTKERTRVDKKTGRVTKVNGSSPIRESVVVCNEDTTIEELRWYCDACRDKWGITALQIHLHRDEGHYLNPDKTGWKPNYHAHIVWDWMNHETGKSCKLDRDDMSLMQDMVAEALSMERGKSKAETGSKHLERNDYIVARQKKESEQAKAEYERLQAENEEKERRNAQLDRQKETAQQQLRQVKSEINTQKMKGAAVNATTAIADGVSSLLGGSKVKRLEAENGQLKQDIKELEQQVADVQAGKKKDEAKLYNHINELDKKHLQEISRYTGKLEQINTYFPHVEELLPVAAECRNLGFTEDMTKQLVNFQPVRFRGKLYSRQHNRDFEATNATATIEKNPGQNGKFRLCIDGLPLVEWFRQKFQELKERLGLNTKKDDERPQFRMKM